MQPAWRRFAVVHQWIEIAGTALSTVAPDPLPGTSPSSPASKITAWCGAALKRAGSVYYIGMAGGHADYAGNEINALDLSVDVPAWAEVSACSADVDIYNRTGIYADLRGGSYHTYNYLQFIDSIGKLVGFNNPGVDYSSGTPPYSVPGDWPYASGGGAPANYDFRWSPAFDPVGGEFESPTYVPEFPTTAGDWTAAMCVKHQTTGDVYIARSGDRWRKLTAATRTWSTPSAEYEQNYTGQAIDPTRDRMLIVGGFSAAAPRVRDLDGHLISVTFGGLGAGAITVAAYHGVVYDEENDRFLVFVNTDPLTVYAVDADTWAVSAVTTTGVEPAQRSNGIHNSVQYVPEMTGVVYANSYTGNVLFMRTA